MAGTNGAAARAEVQDRASPRPLSDDSQGVPNGATAATTLPMAAPTAGEGTSASADAPDARQQAPQAGAGHLADPVEVALADALQRAAVAGRFDVVAQLARELEARRTARPTVAGLDFGALVAVALQRGKADELRTLMRAMTGGADVVELGAERKRRDG